MIALVCALALAATAVVADRAFERLPHLEDELAYRFQARTLALGRLTAPTPAHADAFWIPFVLDYQGQRFGKYPPGWPAVLALGERVGQPWLVNPILAAIALYLVYRLGRTLYDARTGVLAAALGLTSPLLFVLAGSYLSHLASLVWLLLFTRWFIYAAQGRNRWYAVGSGVALGLAFLTRSLTAVGYAVPFVAYSLAQIALRRQRHWPNYLLVALAGAAVSALLLAYQWAVTGDPLLNPYVLWWPYDKIGFGPGIGWMPGGHSLHYAWLNLRQDLKNAATDVLGWPGLSWLPVALALIRFPRNAGAVDATATSETIAEHPEQRAAARSRRIRSDLLRKAASFDWTSFVKHLGAQTRSGCWRIFGPGQREWLLLTPFITLVIAYMFYWIGSPVRLWGPRYYFEGFAVLWIASAVGLLRLWDWAGSWRPRRLRPALLALLAALLIANLGINLPNRLAQVQALYGSGRALLAPVEAADLHNALVFVSGDHWRDYGAFLAQMGPLLDDDVLYPTSEGAEKDAAVTADYPGRAVYYLIDGELRPHIGPIAP